MDEPVFVIPLWADLIAVGLGGIQGALFASGFRGQRRLDLLGVAIIGIVVGMGGGLIRDLLLNVTPITLQSNWYLLTATGAALFGMLLAGLFQRLNAVIVGLDALVIGLFGAFGTSKALALGLPLVPAVFVGRLRGGRRRHPARHDHGTSRRDHARRLALRGGRGGGMPRPGDLERARREPGGRGRDRASW